MQREAALGARQGVEIHPQVGHPSVVLCRGLRLRPLTCTLQRRRLPFYIHARARVARQLLRRKTRRKGGGEWPSGCCNTFAGGAVERSESVARVAACDFDTTIY